MPARRLRFASLALIALLVAGVTPFIAPLEIHASDADAYGGRLIVIWNQAHLLRALREFECFSNAHRPHQGIANARPLHPLPDPITDPVQIAVLDVRRRDRLGGILHEYEHAA